MKTTIILILFMFSFNCLMAVPVQIKGKVQEKGTGNPIEFADVVLTKKGETERRLPLIGYCQRRILVNGETDRL